MGEFFLSFQPRTHWLIWERRGRERGRETPTWERSISALPLLRALTFRFTGGAPATEPHLQGVGTSFQVNKLYLLGHLQFRSRIERNAQKVPMCPRSPHMHTFPRRRCLPRGHFCGTDGLHWHITIPPVHRLHQGSLLLLCFLGVLTNLSWLVFTFVASHVIASLP